MNNDLERSRRLYQTLHLPDFSSIEEVRQAYKTLVLKYHPDKNLHDPTAAERFRCVTLAYEILSNEEKKRKYDTALRVRQPLGVGSVRCGSTTPRSVAKGGKVPTHCATTSIYEELNTYALRKAERPGRRAPSVSTPRGVRPSLYTKEQRMFFRKREKEHQAELRKRWEQEKREQWEREREALRKQQMRREETQHIFQLHRAVNSARRTNSSRVQRGTSAHISADNGRPTVRSSAAQHPRMSTSISSSMFTPSPRTRCASTDGLNKRMGTRNRSVVNNESETVLHRRVGRESEQRIRPTGLRPRGAALIESENTVRRAIEAAAGLRMKLLYLQTKELWQRAVYVEENHLAREVLHLLEEERRYPMFANNPGFFISMCNRQYKMLYTDEAISFATIVLQERESTRRLSIKQEYESTLLSYRCMLSLFQRKLVMNKLLKRQRGRIEEEERLFRNMLYVSMHECGARHQLQEAEKDEVTQLIRRRANERHIVYMKYGEQARLAERKSNAVITASLQKEVERLQHALKSLAVQLPYERELRFISDISARAVVNVNEAKPDISVVPPCGVTVQTRSEASGAQRDPQKTFHRRVSSAGDGSNFNVKLSATAKRGSSPGCAVRRERAALAQQLRKPQG